MALISYHLTGWIWVLAVSMMGVILGVRGGLTSLWLVSGVWLGVSIWELYKRVRVNSGRPKGILQPIPPPNYGRFRVWAIVLTGPMVIATLAWEARWTEAAFFGSLWGFITWDLWKRGGDTGPDTDD